MKKNNMYGTFLTIELGRLLGLIPKDLELDLTYEKGMGLYSEFQASEFNDTNKGEYDCIYNFLLSKTKT